MKTKGILLTFSAIVLTAGCASQSQVLQQGQAAAVNAAQKRGQFDMSCPNVTTTVLSSDYIQPAIQGGVWMAREGVTRLEYTIGVDGCGKKEVYVVMCQEGTNTCFAADSHAPHQ